MAGRTYRRADSSFLLSTAAEQQAKTLQENAERKKYRITGAHTTRPIEDMRMVKRWMDIAREHDAHRINQGVSWYMLLLLGFNTGLRISDICKLRVKDIRGRERVTGLAQKTDKDYNVKFQKPVQKYFEQELKGRDGDDYILASRQRDRITGEQRPISRQRAYCIVKKIATMAGYQEHVGCHTMRKTFAFRFYKASNGDLAKLQKILRHDSTEVTLHYLGLDQQTLDDVVDNMPTFL